MWTRVSCEQPLNTSQSILRLRGSLIQLFGALAIIEPNFGRKGIWSIFQNLVAEPFRPSYLSWQRDATRRRPPELWEELSFLHKPPRPWNPLAGRMGFGLAKSAAVLAASTSAWWDLENPGEITADSHQLVPISAAGLQGEQPLVDRIM